MGDVIDEAFFGDGGLFFWTIFDVTPGLFLSTFRGDPIFLPPAGGDRLGLVFLGLVDAGRLLDLALGEDFGLAALA